MPAIPKERPVRSEPYRRLVAALPCFNCGAAAPSQAAHADMGKGMGIKSSDLTCYPLCPRCHTTWGASGHVPRDDRRKFELAAADITQRNIIAMSQDDPKIRNVLVKVGLVK
jgi:hypothetical protein